MNEMRQQIQAEVHAGMAAMMSEMRQQCHAVVQAGMAAMMSEMRCALAACQCVGAPHRGASAVTSIDEGTENPSRGEKPRGNTSQGTCGWNPGAR